MKQISNQCWAIKQALSDTGDLEQHNKDSGRLAELLRGESSQVLQIWTKYNTNTNTLVSFMSQEELLMPYHFIYNML